MTNLSKFSLMIVTIAVVAGAGLWMLGGKQVEYSTALQIDASPEVVFTYLTDPDRHKDWAAGLSEVGAFKPNTPANGNPVRMTTPRVVTVDGQSKYFEDEVLRYEPEKVLSVKSSNPTLILTSIFLLEPRESQTHLSYRVKRANSGLGRFIAPLRKDLIQTQIDADIRRLKELIETNSTNGKTQNVDG
jgi:hypothetical protein